MRSPPYHQKVGLWVCLVLLQREDAGALQVLRQGDAQVGVVEDAQILHLTRVGDSDLAGFHGEVRLSQPATLDEDIDCGG